MRFDVKSCATVSNPSNVPTPAIDARLSPPAYAAPNVHREEFTGGGGTIFLIVVAAITFAVDIGSKTWAERALKEVREIVLIDHYLSFELAHNRGAAWGVGSEWNDNVRIPFFLGVSAVAISFITSLYRKLRSDQDALRWGLPLVLGGALGNVFDRVRYGEVVDFVLYRADWVLKLNEKLQRVMPKLAITDRWPTFNVADVAIGAGLVLMAIDMMGSKRAAAAAAARAA